MLVWQQCVVGLKLPRGLQKGKELWSLVRGLPAWILWIDRNANTFSNDVWTQTKLEILRDAELDLGQMAWMKTTQLIKRFSARIAKFIKKFDYLWCRMPCFYKRTGLEVEWNHRRPSMDIFT